MNICAKRGAFSWMRQCLKQEIIAVVMRKATTWFREGKEAFYVDDFVWEKS